MFLSRAKEKAALRAGALLQNIAVIPGHRRLIGDEPGIHLDLDMARNGFRVLRFAQPRNDDAR